MAKKTKWNAQSHITDLIIAGLEKGVGPWVRPWKVKGGLGLAPFNPCTSGGRAYNGLNPWTLALASMENGWTDPRFCTFKQLAAKKWTIKEGEARKAGGPGPSDVYFWLIKDRPVEDEATGKVSTRKSFSIRVYKVWNYQQLEGPEAWESDDATAEYEETTVARTQELAWTVAEAWEDEVVTRHGGSRACYSPSLDIIKLPELQDFNTEADYLGTRFHEQIHSTGHESREARDFSGRFGNEAYAFEELVAEIGAANLLAATGAVGTGEVREDHVAYLASWIKVLKSDHKAIFTADSQAKKGVKRILDHAEKAGVLPKPTKGGSTKPKGKARKKRSKAKAKAA